MRTTQELKVYHSLISQVIMENPDDPRIETPKKSLRIIEEELERRNNMPNFEKMDIDDLERYREKIAAKRNELKANFIAAGKVLDVKRQKASLLEDYERLEAKRAALREKIGEPEPQTVGLKTLILKATKGKLGG